MFTGGENISSNNQGSYNKWDKTKLEEIINNYDKEMLTTLSDLYASLTGERLDLNNIANSIELLAKYNEKSEYNYLNNLLMPEKCKNVKIPSPIPVPSCSFQLHNCVTLTPNSQGNIGIIFNPFFLMNKDINMSSETVTADTGFLNKVITQNGTVYASQQLGTFIPENQEFIYSIVSGSSLLVNNDEMLSGTEPNDNWVPVNINQAIPGVYDQYRLVSASIVIKYIGRLDIVSGVIGGAVIFDELPLFNGRIHTGIGDGTINAKDLLSRGLPAGYTNMTPYAKYGNFDLAMDSFYHQENLCLEGLRQLYFPLDNSYEEYCKLINNDSITSITAQMDEGIERKVNVNLDPDNYKSGFKFFIYTLGAPNTPCLKLDIYCNYECLPNAQFLNYMPTSVSTYGLNSKDKKEILDVVQKKPIMKANEIVEVKTPGSMGWKNYMKDMAKRFKNGLPPMAKLTNMVTSIVPKLKPAMGVVGTMISSAAQNANNTGFEKMEEETPK